MDIKDAKDMLNEMLNTGKKEASPETRAKFPLAGKRIPLTNCVAFGLAIVLAAALIACNRQSSASSTPAGSGGAGGVIITTDSDYRVSFASDNTIIIEKYSGNRNGNIVIPATIQGSQVTELGSNAFSQDTQLSSGGLTGVQLPEGIRKIGSQAFYNTNITTINIPGTVTEIGGEAFANCQYLESVSIPDSVSVFGEGIFHNSGLKTFNFPAGLIAMKKIPGNMFRESSLENALIIPEGIERIEENAFNGLANITNVTLPSTIKYIGRGAFSSSNQREVIIPESVESIEFDMYGVAFGSVSRYPLAVQVRLSQVGYSGYYARTGSD